MPTAEASTFSRLSESFHHLFPHHALAQKAVQSFTSKGWELPLMPIEPTWILEGEPVARGLTLNSSEDGLLSSGLWECTRGKFEWVYFLDEIVFVLEGRAVIREESGKVHDLGPGDMATFPNGCTLKWQIDDYVRKFFVVRSPAPSLKDRARSMVRSMKGNAPLSPGAFAK